jgi:hypothetical protein
MQDRSPRRRGPIFREGAVLDRAFPAVLAKPPHRSSSRCAPTRKQPAANPNGEAGGP